MTPQQSELVADYLLDHPEVSPQEAAAVLRQTAQWPGGEPLPDFEVGPPLEAVPSTEAERIQKALEEERAPSVADSEGPSMCLPLAAVEGSSMEVGAGLEEFGADDVRIPQLKIRQAQTKDADGVPDGVWFLTSDLEGASDTREVVFLEMRKERSLLLPYGGGDAADAMIQRIHQQTGVEVPDEWEGPVCFSRDRIQPIEQEGIAVLSERCKTCPLSRWRSVRGRRLQDCGESYRILVFDLEAQIPAVVYARGSAIRPVRDLLTNLQVACRRRKLPAYGFHFTLSTKKRDSSEGTYFVPVFGRPTPIEDTDEIAQYGGIRQACAAVRAEEEGRATASPEASRVG